MKEKWKCNKDNNENEMKWIRIIMTNNNNNEIMNNENNKEIMKNDGKKEENRKMNNE